MKKAKAAPKTVKGATAPAVKKAVARHAGNKGALITVLQEVQAELGYLSGQTIEDRSAKSWVFRPARSTAWPLFTPSSG